MSTLGSRLKLIREEKDLTQKEVARQTGLIRATLANWEIGRTEPDIDSLKKLADFYDISVDWLLGRPAIPEEYYKSKNIEYIKVLEEYERKGIPPERIKQIIDDLVDIGRKWDKRMSNDVE